jgi:hypothetical protein
MENEQVIIWKTGQPSESVKEPLLTRRNSPFRWGLQYKLPNDEGKKVWKIAPEVREWAEIQD